AVRTVAQKLGIPLPRMEFSGPQEAREFKLRGALLDIHEIACNWFQEQLRRPEASQAREYLVGRGLNEKTIAEFRVGFAPDSGFLLRDFLKNKFDDELLQTSGLLSWKHRENARPLDSAGQNQPGSARDDHRGEAGGEAVPVSSMYAKFRDRIMFPICNEQGKVIAFTGRIVAHGGNEEKHGPKYLNSPETPIYSKSHVLFNLDKAKPAIRDMKWALLVEGQMDCISVYAAGIHNVIATSGTAFTEAQVRMLGRHTKNIIVNFDPDTAGAAAAERSLGMLVQEDFQPRVLTLETGFDPDLFVRNKGVDAYVAALRSAPKYFDYLIERARTQFPHTGDGKVKAINYLLPHIQRVPSRIARDELANEIAQRLGIDSAVLRQELRHTATARSSAQVKPQASSQVTQAERILIRALASSPAAGVGENGSVHDPRDPEAEFDPARQVRFALSAERLQDGLGTEALVDALLQSELDAMSLPLNDKDRALVAETLLDETEELTPELLENTIKALRRRALERRQREIKARIAEAERKRDSEALGRLLQEKVEVDRALSGTAASS
ncbi:MAG TPA: toprim domain-containing protein, partial [Terriglobales bacterium]|nr:toprim domain-containing protein [Terriglobales bacterium]